MTTKYEYGPWRLHDGGECPVDPDALVQIVTARVPFGDRENCAIDVRRASDLQWRWNNGGDFLDIALYRIVIEKKPLVRYMAELDAGSGRFMSSVVYETPEEAEELAKHVGYKLCRAVRFVEDSE